MQPAAKYTMVLVTAPSLRVARKLARAILSARLAACVNFIPNLESHYWWQGKLEKSREVLLLIKTMRGQVAPLEKLVLKIHPYDTPEIVSISLQSGNARYLAWIAASAKGTVTPA